MLTSGHVILLMLLTLGLSALNVQNVQADPVGLSWTSKAPIPHPTGQASVVAGPDGRIYLIGGSSGGLPNNTARAYEPSSNTWASIANLPTATRGAASAVGLNGLIYVTGGASGATATQAYNVTSNTWTTRAPIPSASWMGAAATGDDGRIYVIGGEGSETLVQIYNPASNTWSSGTAMPTARQQLAVVKTPTGLIYAIGGCMGCPPTLATVEEYDPISNRWQSRTSMPRAKNSFAAALGPDNLIYVFGGSTTYGNGAAPYLDTVEAYDPAADRWFTVGNIPTPRREVSAATAPSGRIYIMGGSNGAYLTTNEEARVLFPNRSPEASVVSITPNPSVQGSTITFTGSGLDSDGSIVEYRWRSSLSGTIGTTATFTKNDLPPGTHNIYFSVKDDSGTWSQEVLAVVTVNATPSSDPTYQSVQNTMILQIVTLLAVVATAAMFGYGMLSRKKPPPAST